MTAYVAIPREKEKKKVVGNSEKRKSTDRSSLKSAFTYPTHLSRYSGALSLLFLPQSERLNKYMPNSPSQLPFTVSKRLKKKKKKTSQKKKKNLIWVSIRRRLKKRIKKSNPRSYHNHPFVGASQVHSARRRFERDGVARDEDGICKPHIQAEVPRKR